MKRSFVMMLAFLVLGAGFLAAAEKHLPSQVPMEVSTEGPSAADLLAQQREMHQWLTEQIPAETLDHPIKVRLTDDEALDLQRSMASKSDPFKVGLVKSVMHPVNLAGVTALSRTASPASGGLLQATDDGGFIWSIAVSSEGAVGIRVGIEKMDLPGDADLFIMNQAGQAFGPWTRQGPNGDGQFWTNTVSGDTAIVVLRHYGPGGAADLARTSFAISGIGHLGPAFAIKPTPSEQSFCSFNASCVENASCFNVAAANPAKSAVALMQWISGAFIYTCTGGLIADSDTGTNIPYFLTANHCINRSGDAANLETYFQFTVSCGSTNCPSQTNPGGIQRLGATIKATGSGGDYTLLQLSQAPPSGSVWLGWNSTAIANTNNAPLYRISHPAWAPQAYSAHHVDTGAPTCQGWPRGERIYSRDDVGATEGGSSGSPVVNASSQIVGQLSGACGFNTGNVCDSASNATVDGAFAFYFSSVSPFLAGGGGGCTPSGGSCTANSQCCSNSCKGPKNNKSCR